MSFTSCWSCCFYQFSSIGPKTKCDPFIHFKPKNMLHVCPLSSVYIHSNVCLEKPIDTGRQSLVFETMQSKNWRFDVYTLVETIFEAIDAAGAISTRPNRSSCRRCFTMHLDCFDSLPPKSNFISPHKNPLTFWIVCQQFETILSRCNRLRTSF